MTKFRFDKFHVIFSVLGFSVGLAAMLVLKSSQNATPNEDKLVYAISGSQTIMGADVLPKIKEDLRQVERSKYLLKKKAVMELLFEKQNLGRTADDGAAAKGPEAQFSKEEFAQFLKLRGLDFSKITKKQQEDVVNNFKIFKQMQARKVQEQDQAKNMKVEWRIPMTFLDPPISLAKGALSPLIDGSSDKTLIIFANYHCPYCKETFAKIKTLQEKFAGKAKLHFRFAMNEPETSVVFLSGLATMCANEQGKFQTFFQNMFEGVAMDQQQIFTVADRSQLDRKKFEDCMRSDSAKKSLRSDIEQSKKLGVDRSAVIFINGHQMAIQEPFENLEEVIYQR